jgi:hypothetical protein
LTALPGTVSAEKFPGASDLQLAALQLLVTASFFVSSSVASNRVLKVADLAGDYGGTILSLPKDQWVQEVVGWERFIWAHLRIFISDYAVGYHIQDPSAEAVMRKNMTQAERSLCGMQKMRKSGGFM